jgi:large subunit ribosomal protein L10
MFRSVFVLSFCVVVTGAFVVPAALQQPQRPKRCGGTGTVPTNTRLDMGGSSGYASSRAGKEERVSTVRGLLENAQMVFTVPAGEITVSQAQKLRRSMPDGTTMTVVKNTIMNRAVEGTEFEPATSLLTGSNMWFFIEEDIGATIQAWNAFTKENKKEDTHPVSGGVIEGKPYDAAGVQAIGTLPSKKELYAKIAGSIKAVPAKVARVIKAPSTKLVRAIKLATMPDE